MDLTDSSDGRGYRQERQSINNKFYIGDYEIIMCMYFKLNRFLPTIVCMYKTVHEILALQYCIFLILLLASILVCALFAPSSLLTVSFEMIFFLFFFCFFFLYYKATGRSPTYRVYWLCDTCILISSPGQHLVYKHESTLSCLDT